jgi:peptide-methionine (S)-S-oxide reductase
VESIGDNSSFPDCYRIFNSDEISVKTLIEIHLHTHQSTSNHSMRHKYRSAHFLKSKKQEVEQIIATFQSFQKENNNTVFLFKIFKASRTK